MHSYEELNSAFEYRDGKLFWKVSPRYNICIGQEAGSKDSYGYTETQYLGVRYKRHRLIYYLHTGVWPPIIDHIDQDRTNDKFENLRATSQLTNVHNTKSIWGKIPFRGVSLKKDRNKYSAIFFFKGQRKFLGHYDTAEEASEVYQKYKQFHTAHLV